MLFNSILSTKNVENTILNEMLNKVSEEELFSAFSLVYKKNYETQEIKETCFKYFQSNLKKANKGFLNEIEFTKDFDAYKPKEVDANIAKPDYKTIFKPANNVSYDAIDYTTSSNCICPHPVKTNGSMSYMSSEAMATAIGAAYCLKTNAAQICLSTQQFCDCTEKGCSTFPKYMYYTAFKGIYLAEDYTFTGSRSTCQTKNSPAISVTSWENQSAPSKTVLDFKTIYDSLARGPLVVGLNFYQGISTYTSGILTPPSSTGACSFYTWTTLVGFGTENGVDYWLLKAYTGSSKADGRGFFKLIRDDTKLNWGINCGYSRPIIA